MAQVQALGCVCRLSIGPPATIGELAGALHDVVPSAAPDCLQFQVIAVIMALAHQSARCPVLGVTGGAQMAGGLQQAPRDARRQAISRILYPIP